MFFTCFEMFTQFIFIYLFIISIVREAQQKNSIVQYKSGAKVKQEKAYAMLYDKQ